MCVFIRFVVMGCVVAFGLCRAHAQGKEQAAANRDGWDAPVVAVDNACAWPKLAVLGDGDVVAIIYNQPNHGTSAGDLDCWATSDGGRNWEFRGRPAPHEPQINRIHPAVGVAKNGDLIVISTGWSNEYPEGRRGAPFRADISAPWISRSSDGGRTWTMDKSSFPTHSPAGARLTAFGNIVLGHDGAPRVAMSDMSSPRRAYIYRSDDDGGTWDQPVPLYEGDDDVVEVALLHRGEGHWMAAGRRRREGGLNLYTSSDDANTWSFGRRLTEPSQHPGNLLQLKDGRILLTYGNRSGEHGIDAMISDDQGASWSKPVRLVHWSGDGGYPASVQRPDGGIITAYYARRAAYHPRYHMGVVIWRPDEVN